ncbi:hypothetical protein AB0F81_44580 [Actinoplanes sp. NPDC024001]|uniref:hypothetical protein n=1 Tax=Actinoplanes sp. NPDC024001 TaxID=3154598 RepID=UPI00340DADA7
MTTTRTRRLAGAALLSLTLLACGTPDEPEDVPHGYVAGAEELPEAQTTIAYAARDGRRLHLLDLATGSQKPIDLTVSARTISEDGRFVYVHDGDRRLEIVDTGVWTVDHTDHVHYYRAPARSLGVLTADATITTVAGFGAHTTVGTADGTITVLDRRELESGAIVKLTEIDSRSATALAVPYADGLLVAAGDDPTKPADRIVAMDADGRETGALRAPCPTPGAWVTLRAGAIIACDNHLVRVKLDNDRLTAKALPAPDVPGHFGYRPRSNEAAAAGRTGILSVHASQATVRHLPAAGRRIVAAASPADGTTVLALDRSGTLLSYDLETGRILAEKPLRAAGLTLDINRAYLPEPAARVIHEIDYRDGLRTARTLPATEQPDLMVELGR